MQALVPLACFVCIPKGQYVDPGQVTQHITVNSPTSWNPDRLSSVTIRATPPVDTSVRITNGVRLTPVAT